jgi:glycosyltransferase involved in cell wall biosynthesis
MNPKRILFVINNVSNAGGTERVTTHVANLLESKGFDVDILSIYQNTSETFFPVNSTINQYSLYSHDISLLKSVLPAAIKMRKFAKNYDVVIFSDTQLGLISWLTALTTKVRVVLWEHFNSLIVTRFGSRWFGRKLAAWFSDLVVVLTKQDKTSWQKKYWLKSSIIVIANPSAIKAKDQPINALRNKEVISVGRYTEQKGFDMLIEAWASISSDVRGDWRLKIIGPNGSAKPLLQAQVEQLSECNIELAGPSSDMAEVYDNADVYVMSSRYEGFGLTLIEAMSSGLPVAAFDCPMGPGEIIDNQYGLTVPAKDIAGLTVALMELISDESLRVKLSQQSLLRAKDFDEQSIALIWQTRLNELLQR